MPIKCCKDCMPPTRHPGCHSKCNKYLKEKAKWEEQNYVIHPSDFKTLACIHKPHKDKRRK